MEKDIYAKWKAERESINWGAVHVRADQRQGFAVNLQRNGRRIDPEPGILSRLLGRL